MSENAENIKIFKPTMVTVNPLDIKKNKYNKTLFEGAEDGFIKMDVDKEVAIQRMSRDLYQYAASGLRELYVNEVRACVTARDKYGANPTIIITVNDDQRRLVIEGIDSMGMSADRFKRVYTVLGHSDNFEGNVPGQFGMGRAAYTCLSDTMILNTYSRESKEKYAVLGRNGVGYTILPEPDILSYGTRIEILLHKNIERYDFDDMMKKMSWFSGIKTVLVTKSGLGEDTGTKTILGPISVSERIDERLKETIPSDIKYRAIPIHLEDDLICIDGNILVKKTNIGKLGYAVDDADKDNEVEAYLLGVPIDGGEISIPLNLPILNVKNERILSPTPDRERFTEKSLKGIQERINKLFSEFNVFDISSLQEYHNSENRDMYHAISEHGDFYRHNTDYEYGLSDNIGCTFNAKTKRLMRLLNADVRQEATKVLPFRDLYSNQDNMFYLEKWDKSKVAALNKMFENPPQIVVVKEPQNIGIFKEFGVVSGDEFLESQNVEIKKIRETATDCSIHYSSIIPNGYSTYIPVKVGKTVP